MKTGPPDFYSLSESDRWVVLARYLAGESDAAEAEAVRHWVADQPARGELLAALEQVSHPAGQTSAAPVDVERGLARVKARFHDAEARSLLGRRGFGEQASVHQAHEPHPPPGRDLRPPNHDPSATKGPHPPNRVTTPAPAAQAA